MKFLDDGSRLGESAEERRRIAREVQDVLDAAEYRTLVGDWRPGDPEPIGVLSLIPLPPPGPKDIEYLRHRDAMCAELAQLLRVPPETIDRSYDSLRADS